MRHGIFFPTRETNPRSCVLLLLDDYYGDDFYDPDNYPDEDTHHYNMLEYLLQQDNLSGYFDDEDVYYEDGYSLWDAWEHYLYYYGDYVYEEEEEEESTSSGYGEYAGNISNVLVAF